MPKRALSDRTLKSLKPAKAGQRYEIADAVMPGLVIRVTDRGTKTFALVARYPGSSNPTRRALGEYGPLGLAEARDKARHWHALIARGIDPAAEEERARTAELRQQQHTFTNVAEDFIREKLSTERRGIDAERTIRGELLPAWGKRPIDEISPLDVLAVIRPIKERAPYQAHATLSLCKRLFSWAVDAHVYGLMASPCDRLKPAKVIGQRKPRQRMLSDDEVRALWRAAGRMGYPYGGIARMLLLTGQRHHEVSGAPWSEIDLAKSAWTIDPVRFKSDAEHCVPLTGDVLALLDEMPRFKSGTHIFTTTFGVRPTRINASHKTELDARMLRTLRAMARRRGDNPKQVELRPWVIHDLRRVVRSHLAALRVPDHIAEMVIGHGRKGIQRVYDQHRYESEMREALTLWAGRLRTIVEPAPANVLPLRTRAR
jgi:integrase